MKMPSPLEEAIAAHVQGVPARDLERAAASLSERYRAGGVAASRAASTPVDVAAYLATRAPATYAAVADVLRRVALARADFAPASLLDLGAGPGVAAWAAVATWPQIARIDMVEVEPAMTTAGKEIGARGGGAVASAAWQTTADTSADLVIASYLLGELTPTAIPAFAADSWSLTADTLVVVEPGTTAGYHRILAVRDAVVAAGGFVLAPCPHERRCPLPEGDWCHFSTRLARSRTHRLAKGAERGFEDEKLSYVVLSRTPQTLPAARVIRRPDPRPGHIVLDLCTRTGLEQRTVSKKEGPAYRQARKLGWGDAL